MIEKNVHVLLVEDMETDAELISRQIHKVEGNYKVQVVQTLGDVEAAIAAFNPQIIISDYNLPTCSGMDVLELVRDKSPTATFVFLTGTLQDEELAAETILNGADGFILKKHMSALSEKLRPYLEKVQNRPAIVQNARNRIKKSNDLIKDIKDYMDDINAENITHQERMKKIRDHLEKMKQSL